MQIMSSSPYYIRGRKMFEKLAGSSENVVGNKATGKLTASDFKGLEPEVKALVEKEGTICILFDMAEFKGETAKGLIADYKFGREFHNQIKKMAVVGDTTWEKWLTQLAKLIYARDSKFFHSSDISKAWAWLRE
jgi:SpoIIAA-like